MRATWDEARARIKAAQQSTREIPAPNSRTEIIVSPIIAETEAPPAQIIPAPKARGGKPGTCSYCGKSFPQALHFHVKRCPERLKLEAAT
jgi:hypothetical protein